MSVGRGGDACSEEGAVRGEKENVLGGGSRLG